jgi:hypothetical protein
VPKDAAIVVGIDETHSTPPWSQDSGKRHLSRSGAFEQRVFRENQRVAMDLDDAVGPHSLGWAGLGLALFHGACPHTRATIGSSDGGCLMMADNSYAVLDLLACAAGLRQPVTVIISLRLNAAFYDSAPVRQPGTNGRPRKKGERQLTLAQRVMDPQTSWQSLSISWYGKQQRLIEVATGTAVWFHNGLPPVAICWVLVRDPEGKFDPQALLCTDQQAEARAILEWFVLQWQMEVTFHEVHSHLGVETQRQWSNLAILRTIPALLGLFSLVMVFAHHLLQGQPLPVRQAAWYTKALPTFSETLAFVRQHLWPVTLSYLSPAHSDIVEFPRVLFERFIQTLAFAA